MTDGPRNFWRVQAGSGFVEITIAHDGHEAVMSLTLEETKFFIQTLQRHVGMAEIKKILDNIEDDIEVRP